jgi:hypothetical protein
MPGQGAGSFELPYEIDPYGKLVCQIPDGVVYGSPAIGGWGYTPIKQDIVLEDTPINLAKGLKESVTIPSVKQAKGVELITHVDTIIATTKLNPQSAVSGSAPYNQLNRLNNYRAQLDSYIKGSTQNINQASFKDVEELCKTTMTLNWTDLKDAPKLRSTTEMPSLIGVRPVPYSDTEDLGGSPSYGEDEFGLGYAINYTPIRDSGWGTHN